MKTKEKDKKTTKTKAAKAPKAKAKKGAAKDIKDLFEDGLKDIYWAEKALTKALPEMIKNATDATLKESITSHLEETNNQVTRLEACFKALGKKAVAKKCDAMKGLLEEADGIIKETEAGPVRDAGIISASQKVEHYEIASYVTLAAFAKVLKEGEVLKLLLETLEEEKKYDELLTKIADTNLNTQAIK